MTEHEAWLRLAVAWRSPTSSDVAIVNGNRCHGLCMGVIALVLPSHIEESMMRAIRKEGKRLTAHPDWYVWPLSQEGSRQRAEFCEKMVEATKSSDKQEGTHVRA